VDERVPRGDSPWRAHPKTATSNEARSININISVGCANIQVFGEKRQEYIVPRWRGGRCRRRNWLRATRVLQGGCPSGSQTVEWGPSRIAVVSRIPLARVKPESKTVSRSPMSAPMSALKRIFAWSFSAYYVLVITSASAFHTHGAASRSSGNVGASLAQAPLGCGGCGGHRCGREIPAEDSVEAEPFERAVLETEFSALVFVSGGSSDGGVCPICSFLANKPFSAEKSPAPRGVILPPERIVPAFFPFIRVIRFTWRHRAPPLLG